MFIFSLGGSLLYKETSLDLDYIKNFCNLVRKYKEKIKGIVVGGGYLARRFQKELSFLEPEDLDWIGIRATHINAEIIRCFLKDIAYENILTSYDEIPKTKKILIGGGWLPGCSTDYDACLLALKLGIKTVVNLTNVDGLYDKDPRIYKDAKLIKDISWKDVKKMVGEWKPGLNFPVDPKACELAEKEGITFIILNGKKLDNLEKFLKGEEFVGTIIHE